MEGGWVGRSLNAFGVVGPDGLLFFKSKCTICVFFFWLLFTMEHHNQGCSEESFPGIIFMDIILGIGYAFTLNPTLTT